MDLAKTFDTVYGIGAGSNLDTEILVYMKSQGWPERIQVYPICDTLAAQFLILLLPYIIAGWIVDGRSDGKY